MKLLDIQAAIGTAILLLSAHCDAKHSHQLSHLEVLGKRHNHNRLHASPRAEGLQNGVQKRGQCAFPYGDLMVAVTPDSSNAGWAMSPDQSCTPGKYCPYACKPGYVMDQWNPAATSYTYPLSMDGGAYCNSDGSISKPFPNNPWCVPGTGSVGAQNNVGDIVSFCQTVLPGNEAMLIPTPVEGNAWSQLAIPGPSYWCSTAAHFYVNTPGLGTDEACIWGDGSKPLGNWSPYVSGGNTDSSGNTFFKIGWNPIYTASSFANTKPNFGIKVVCSGSNCNGLPCSIDPSVNGIGGVTSSDQAVGAGGASFCVVTVPKGETANIVVFSAGDSSSSGSSPHSSSSAAPTKTSTTAAPPSSTRTTASSSTTPTSQPVSTSSKASHTISILTTSSSVNSTLPTPTPDNSAHILFQNGTGETGSGSSSFAATSTGILSASASSESPIASATKKSSAPETFSSGSFLGFVILFVAAGYLL